MLFNSFVFLFAFLPVVLLVYWSRLLGAKSRLFLLTAASYVFYGYWDWRFTPLMLAATAVAYFGGGVIAASDNESKKKWALGLTVSANLAILCFFKYSGMLASTINALSDPLGVGALPVPNIVLPIGISFYTFQAMSYPIDLYRDRAHPALSFIHFAAYVSLFPQLIAGPIVRYEEIDDQLRNLQQRPSYQQFNLGIQFFVLGLAKKLLIADLIAQRCDPLFLSPDNTELFVSWLMLAGYTLQIYFDFSAYSDMAVGLGSFLGFRFPQNFDSPYKATDISDFWKRWHMTLSAWLRDYLYVPLGGSRGGNRATLRNLTITMFLGGLWHGAAWTYVAWGLYHGWLLVVFHTWKRHNLALPKLAGCAVTFLAVSAGWVFFRSPDFGFAVTWLQSLVGLNDFQPDNLLIAGGRLPLLIVIGFGLVWFAPNSWQIKTWSSPLAATTLAAIAFLCILALGRPSPFLYFQF